MNEKTQAALKALRDAQAAIQRAIEACGDARLSFIGVTEPLLGAHQCVSDVLRTVDGSVNE